MTLPLTRYEELQKSTENASATVIDTLSLAGTFRDHNLTITFAGRSVGARAATTVISGAPDLTLSGCSGDALIVRSSKGAYDLIALAPSFTLRCDARRAAATAFAWTSRSPCWPCAPPSRTVSSCPGDDGADDVRGYSLVRQVAGGNETLAATATGRYLITLLPDTTRFRYVIQIHNPNRNTSPLLIHLVSGEHLQQIDSAAPYEPKDGSYAFAMPPGDSTITMTGELQGTTFAPPVEASLQYVVVESHPLLRPAMKSAAKRLSTGETGITTQYRGALGVRDRPARDDRLDRHAPRGAARHQLRRPQRHPHAFRPGERSRPRRVGSFSRQSRRSGSSSCRRNRSRRSSACRTSRY